MPNHNSVTTLENLGASALANFFASYTASQQEIEQSLMLLELSPDDGALLLTMQQDIAQIQQSLQDLGLDNLSPLTTSLNKLVHSLQLKEFSFETLISDLILLAINDVKMVIEKIIDGDSRCVLVDRLPRICESIEAIPLCDDSDRPSVIRDALLLLDPTMEIIENSITVNDTLMNLFSPESPDEEELAAYGVEESDDFVFFRSLSEPLEQRARYWRGRAHRMLRLALKMNDFAGRPVNPNQLAAAVYMHDAGMALLPLEIINSEQTLTEEQLTEVRQHPVIAYELMRYMKKWREAAQIVLQHHEQVDGKGYPYGLSENEICDGAKILAIADAVDARTHERAHATLMKRPLLRAAIELGKNSGVQFSERWVDVFKEVFHELRKIKEV